MLSLPHLCNDNSDNSLELQWGVVVVEFPMKINFLCPLGMADWKVTFWSSAKEDFFFFNFPRKEIEQFPNFPACQEALGASCSRSESKHRVLFHNRNLFTNIRDRFPWVRMSGIHLQLGFPK